MIILRASDAQGLAQVGSMSTKDQSIRCIEPNLRKISRCSILRRGVFVVSSPIIDI